MIRKRNEIGMGPAESNKLPDLFSPLMGNGAPLWAGPLADCIKAEADDPASRFAVLATADNAGKPHARYIVVRGAMGVFPNDIILANDHQGIDLWLITDARSSKAAELHLNGHAELCWYFRKSRVQFRFSGSIIIYADQQCPIRIHAWNCISEAARVQFYWPEPKTIRDPFHEFEFTVSEPSTTPPNSFLVIQLKIHEVDQLNLNGNPQNRYLYSLTEKRDYEMKEVNP